MTEPDLFTASPWATYSFGLARGDRQLTLRPLDLRAQPWVLTYQRLSPSEAGWLAHTGKPRRYLGAGQSHSGSLSHGFYPQAHMVADEFKTVLDEHGLNPLAVELAAAELAHLCAMVQTWVGKRVEHFRYDSSLTYFQPLPRS